MGQRNILQRQVLDRLNVFRGRRHPTPPGVLATAVSWPGMDANSFSYCRSMSEHIVSAVQSGLSGIQNELAMKVSEQVDGEIEALSDFNRLLG